MDEMKVLGRMQRAAEALADMTNAEVMESDAESRLVQALALALIANNISRAIDASGSLTVFTQEA